MSNVDNSVTSEQINQASLHRVYSYTRNRNIGVVTAYSGGRDEGAAANGHLRDDIRGHGFGLIKARVHYIENEGGPDKRHVNEEIYLVIGKDEDDSGHLKAFLKRQGKNYGQDYVLHKPHDSENVYLIGIKESANHGLIKIENLGRWNPIRMSEFLLKLKWGRFSSNENNDGASKEPHAIPSMRVEFMRGPTFFLRREILF